MMLSELRKQLKAEFAELDIEETDADFIIAEVLNVARTELIFVKEIDEKTTRKILECAEKRKQHMPVDAIFGKTWFYGLQFAVNENVLTPRQDSELVVDAALKEIKANNFKTVLDLCTGSGCLAIAIKANADVNVTATDVSQKAISVAKQNAKFNGVEIDFLRSNMFEAVDGKFDLIVSNPPYIDTEEMQTLDEEVLSYDPKLALDGGDLGLKFYNIIHENARKHLNDGGILILEIGEDQKELVTSLFNDFECVEALKDYGGNDRVLVFKK